MFFLTSLSAWKLVHVLRGWADISLLKTVSTNIFPLRSKLTWFIRQYELERRKYAQDLIDFDRQFAKLFSGKPRTEENQDGVTHEQFIQ